MFQIILLLIALVIFFLFFAKLKIELTIKDELYIDVFIFKYIKIKKFKFNEDELKDMRTRGEKVAKDEVYNYFKNIEFTDAKLFLKNIKEFLGKVKFEKIDFKLNVNVDDYILNSYITTFVNTVIAMLISLNIKNINTENLNYIITSDEKKIKLNLKCILYGKVANIMFVLIKIVHYAFKLKKRGNEENGKGTSNRKFNGNSNVVA